MEAPPRDTLGLEIRDHARPRQLTERAVNYMINATAARAGINPAASVHWLRHAHASHPIDNGEPIDGA